MDYCGGGGGKVYVGLPPKLLGGGAGSTRHVLISDNLLVRENYFDYNIVWNENVRLLRRFSKEYFEADLDRNTCLQATSSRGEM